MADPIVLSGLPWPLPAHPEVADALLSRWSQPHRRYHDVRHLAECLTAAQLLGAGDDQMLAVWFHDAVHTNTPGQDEANSAALVRRLLGRLVASDRIDEIVRLVLLTETHRPAAGDLPGAIVSDADLWILGADPQRYAESVADLRRERGLGLAAWRMVRRPQLLARLGQPIYFTPQGRRREPVARGNLTTELDALG